MTSRTFRAAMLALGVAGYWLICQPCGAQESYSTYDGSYPGCCDSGCSDCCDTCCSDCCDACCSDCCDTGRCKLLNGNGECCCASLCGGPPAKAKISYQSRRDLFYNFYEGPDPNSATAHMYISPRPTPAHVGHTYTTYQPLMPHEYMHAHKRSHYGYQCGAGWTRAKVRYKTTGLWLDHLIWKMNCCY